jgi:CRISPR-associated protein Cas1
MIKRTIEISSSACKLSLQHSQLIIERPDQSQASIPCEDIGLLVIDHAQACYTHSVLITLLQAGAAIIFCGSSHLPEGLLLPLSGHTLTAQRLRSQIDASLPACKQLWRQVVQAKIRHQADVLGANHPSYQKLMTLAEGVKSGDTANVEAHAARIYWQHVLVDQPIKRDPEGDSPNNFLNYGYAILRAAVARAIVGSGLNPTLGIHHRNQYNPYALADDLMEPFRPMIDRRVRLLVAEGAAELGRREKTTLLEFMTDTVRLNDQTGPFMVMLSRMTASFCRCISGEEKTLDIPTPWNIPDTEPCGS